MAKLASIASGNWLTAGTWGLIDPTLFANSETNNTTLSTTYGSGGRSAQATPGAITVSHIGVKLAVRTGTAGTITVHIADSSHVEVAGTAVTINTADLPVAASVDLNGGWHFFKLATPVTLTAATLYEVEAKTSTGSQIGLFASAATNGLSCALITTTTQAPVAGDDLFIQGEYTGAGTSNSFTVTMNETATTDYGAAYTSLVTPAIAISNKGTLTWGVAASTNYNLKVSGNIIMYSGGTMNMGTIGTECPRTSSMTLLLDCVFNVNFGITVRNLGAFNSQGLSRTSGKNYVYCYLNTDEAVNSTSLGVDTDTGWLDNDEIVVATTTRTVGQSEKGTLNGNAGASTLTVDGFGGTGGGLANAHSGTSPTQAEVILLTRNIRISGVSTSAQAYIDIKSTASVDFDWTEFFYLGSSTSNKRGIDVATTTGTFTAHYCSVHDCYNGSSTGFNLAGTSGNGYTVSYCTFWSNGSGGSIAIAATSNTTWSIDHCIVILPSAVSIQYSILDVGGNFTNCTLVGGSNPGINISEGSAKINNISDITVHCASTGILTGQMLEGTLYNLKCYRNTSNGFNWCSNSNLSAAGNITIENGLFFGNNTSGITCGPGGGHNIIFSNCTIAGDSSFAQQSGFASQTSCTIAMIKFFSCTFGSTSGIYVAHTTADISCSTVSATMLLNNCKLDSSTEIGSQTSLYTGAITSQKHNQTAGLHKTWKRYGTILIETTTVHSPGVTSMKMKPNNASFKLTSEGVFGGFKVPVANGQTCTPSVYIYEDASYNGARARLILKRNDALGITSDTVIDTGTAASDAAWEQLTGTTAAVTDNGTLEFIIDCDGTAGNLFVASFSATVA